MYTRYSSYSSASSRVGARLRSEALSDDAHKVPAHLGKQFDYELGRREGDDEKGRTSAMARKRYQAFDPAEWKLQRCQRRLQNINVDSAFDRAQERHRWSAQRWSDRYEREESRYREAANEKLRGESEARGKSKAKTPPVAEDSKKELRVDDKYFTNFTPSRYVPKSREKQDAGTISGRKVLDPPPPAGVDDKALITPGDSVNKEVKCADKSFQGDRNSHRALTDESSSRNNIPGTAAPISRPVVEKRSQEAASVLDYYRRHSSRVDCQSLLARTSKKPETIAPVATEETDEKKKVNDVAERSVKKSDDDDEGSDYTWTDCSDEETDDVPANDAKEPEKRQGSTLNNALVNGHATEVKETEKKPVKKTPPPAQKPVPPKNAITEKRKSLKLAKPVSAKKDLSWLHAKDENLILDSMANTMEKWLEKIKVWSSDPLDSVKGKAATSTFVGTKRTDPYFKLSCESYTYAGDTNFFGKPHGKGVVTFENGDQFRGEFRNESREGYGILKLNGDGGESGGMAYLEGTYSKDRMDGKGRIEFRNGDVLYAWFSAGTVHGLGKMFDKEKRLKHVGWYSNGVLSGLVWKFLEGGGCLVGDVDVTGQFIGDNIAFLFPDHQTCLLGTFIKGKMTMAQTCFIQLVAIRNEMCHLKFTQPRGPAYEFDPGTRETICKQPLLPDPYEAQHCYIRTSKIKGAQEGLFAKRDLPKDKIVCFYNGIRQRSDEIEKDKYDHEANAYKILDLLGEAEDGTEGILDVPAEYVSLKAYRASLAHKANHSFNPNGKFTVFDHPRFGKVPAVVTSAPVEKDCEITVSYDYAMDDAPPWYQELFAQRIINQYKESRMWNF